MLSIKRRPAVLVANVDVSAFPIDSFDQWLAMFWTQVQAARAAGVPCIGRVRVGWDVAQAIYTGISEPIAGEPLQDFLACDDTYGRMTVCCDVSLPANTAVID